MAIKKYVLDSDQELTGEQLLMIKEAAHVVTGDTSNVIGCLAGLLAGAGLMAAGFRRRKKKGWQTASGYAKPDRKGV